ncbi:MAG: HPF/RaiA family ribosome-associated protein [Anaerolineae bacterium]|nr:HPF/RaiA family ribosome-associated protein [Anaerolineae bacterium]
MAELLFPVEFHNEIPETPENLLPLQQEVETHLAKLAQGNDDISNVIVNVKRPAQGRNTPYVHEITIMVYMDGENVVVNEKGELLDGTLRKALDVMDRQVRTQREKRRGL